MLIVRSASRDGLGALGFAAGYALGGVVIISLVCFGFGTWLTAAPEVFDYSKYVMMAYILWLAYGVWKGGFDLAGESTTTPRPLLCSCGAGMLTCFISPYMMILFPLVLPSLTDISTIALPEFLMLIMVTFISLIFGAVLIIVFAAQINRLVRSPRTAKIMNRSLASILVFGGGWMAFA